MSGQGKKLIVKIGSSTLTDATGRIDHAYLAQLADQVARVRAAGWQPIVVSSGAIACGVESLGLSSRPSDLPSLQAAASVGQSAFAAAYANAFAPHGIVTSSVLLTRRDTADRTAYLHARDTMNRLLELGVVPIVNENDTVSVEEIKFGDNDTLAALVACLVEAQLVIILSDIDGLYDANPSKVEGAKLIRRVESIDASIMGVAGDAGSAMGSGGMATKVKAARVLMTAGIPLVIAKGDRADAVVDAANGEEVGTLFAAQERPRGISPRKLWIALGDSAKGALVVDDGACHAIVEGQHSLLCVGVSSVVGHFECDDIVDVQGLDGHVIGRGKVAFSSDEIELACGRTRTALLTNRLLAPLAEKPAIHRDSLIVFD